MMHDLVDRLRRTRVLPVIEIEDAGAAAALAGALAQGGTGAIEFTLRTPAALAALEAAKRAEPSLLVGMGTVVDEDGARRAVDAGADFLVTPGATPDLLAALADLGAPFLPGVATASEAMAARQLGVKFMKFFPAEPAGGLAYLKALAGPFPDLRFCPTGGITAEAAPNYLALQNVVCVGGSWVAPKELIARKDWRAIEANARRATGL
jgi:2-dehydro-3-deoxyphosphogluconate aldolase/(4S)-4-hydroxy-2-oxoglutarate aldolase